jgi:serine/threonine protein kinase
VKSILTEIEMAKRLEKRSRHIVHMYDFDFDRETGLAFIVMELGEQNLEKALSSRPPLSSIERKVLWRQLVDIANTLHNHHIVSIFHCDFI